MGFLFVEPKDPNETVHIFPACRVINGYNTFSDEKIKNIKELENINKTDPLVIDKGLGINEAICHGIGVIVANSTKEKHSIAYFDNQAGTRTHAADRQNAGRNICGNCVRRLYKNDDDN